MPEAKTTTVSMFNITHVHTLDVNYTLVVDHRKIQKICCRQQPTVSTTSSVQA